MSADETTNAKLVALEGQAAALLAESHHCAQTTFAVLDRAFDLAGGQTLRALALFPGVALRGETCGALLGALAALGLAAGRDDLTDAAAFRVAIPAGRKLCRRFEQQFGGTTCAEILAQGLGEAFDLGTTTGYETYLGCGGHELCSRVVQQTVRLAAELMAEGPAADADRNPGVMLTV